jgi:hypothetical protein
MSQWKSWKHSPIYSYKRGRCQVACSCGKLNSGWFNSYVEAHLAYEQHVGLRQERGRARRDSDDF